MPDKLGDEFFLTIYLDELKCIKSEDFGGDEFVIVGVSQSGRTQDEFDEANRTIHTELIKASAGHTYPFAATSATLFARKVKADDYVLVSMAAQDLDFSSSEWKAGFVELSESLTEIAKKAADQAFKNNKPPGRKAGERAGVIDGNIVEAVGKLVLEQIPKALMALFKLDPPDELGGWYPKRDKSQAKEWAKLNGKLNIPFAGKDVKGEWNYVVSVGVLVEPA